jgi:outer membrane immunogenic protein
LGVTLKSVKFALVGASLLIGAGAANAADVYQRGSIKDAPEVYMPPITWTGFYVGAHAGGAFGGEAEFSNDFDSLSLDVDNAFTGGVHVGYNWQASQNWVVGIEGSISALSLEAEDGDLEISDYVASIRGRAGVAFDQNLVYGTAGVAFLGYADDTANLLDDDDTAVGFVIGAGWERKITDNLSFGVEGLYYNFESDVSDEVFDASGVNLETDFWTVTARLNYHFNRGYDSPLK